MGVVLLLLFLLLVLLLLLLLDKITVTNTGTKYLATSGTNQQDK